MYTFSLSPSINDIYRVSNNKHLYFKLLQATGKPLLQIIIEKKMLSKVLFTVLEFWKHNYLNSHNVNNFIGTPRKSRDFKPEVWELKYLSVTSYLKSYKNEHGDRRKKVF